MITPVFELFSDCGIAADVSLFAAITALRPSTFILRLHRASVWRLGSTSPHSQPRYCPSRSGCCPANASQVPNGKQFWDGAGDVEVCGFTGGDNLDWLVLLLTQLRIKSYSPHPKSQGLECRPILVNIVCAQSKIATSTQMGQLFYITAKPAQHQTLQCKMLE